MLPFLIVTVIFSGGVYIDDFMFSLALLFSVDLVGNTSLSRQLWIEHVGPSKYKQGVKIACIKVAFTYITSLYTHLLYMEIYM